jgi:hypothetical protein
MLRLPHEVVPRAEHWSWKTVVTAVWRPWQAHAPHRTPQVELREKV